MLECTRLSCGELGAGYAPAMAPPLAPGAALPPLAPAAAPAVSLLPQCLMTPFAVLLAALLAMVLTPSLRAASIASAPCPAAFMLCTLACAASAPYLRRHARGAARKK